MTWQYIIVGIVVLACVIYAARRAYTEIRENIIYKNVGCAGCAFYEKCKRNKKKPR